MIILNQPNPRVVLVALDTPELMAIRNAVHLAWHDELEKIRVNSEITAVYARLFNQFDSLCADEKRDKVLEKSGYATNLYVDADD